MESLEVRVITIANFHELYIDGRSSFDESKVEDILVAR